VQALIYHGCSLLNYLLPVMALGCMHDSQIYRLQLAGAVSWDKYNFAVAEKCGVLLVSSTLIKAIFYDFYHPVF
jgi:hypothetical protein